MLGFSEYYFKLRIAKMSGRMLTENEKNLADKIFGNSVKYNEVLIFNEKYAFFQPSNSGMTPNGNIYIDGKTEVLDYGSATLDRESKAFFIHEMTHVWQKQNNVLNPIVSAIANSFRHAFFYGESYKYTLESDKDLLEYRMEQQAQIIEDYARVTLLHLSPKFGLMQNKVTYSKAIVLFNFVLSKFIENPSYPKKIR